MTNPSVCRTCDEISQSCCTFTKHPDEEDLKAPISEVEIGRILNHLSNKKMADLFELNTNTEYFVHHIKILFPEENDSVDSIFPLNGSHFELKTKDNACIFKNANGCILPTEARPHFCRIYPFWFFGDTPQIFQDPKCIALKNFQTIPEVFLSLGTTPEKLSLIYSRIRHDWGFSPSIPLEKTKMVF